MTIKEQLNKEINDNVRASHEGWSIELYNVPEAVVQCSFIVEDIAIKFAEWIGDNAYYNSGGWNLCEDDSCQTRKELFELFKKENNL